MKMPPLQNRAAILLFFLFLWAALVAAHLFYYSILESELYIERGNAIAKRSGAIHAKRGKIIDRNGKVLAWTTMEIDLYVNEKPEFPFYRNKLERAIAKYFIDFTFPAATGPICLQKNLSPMDQIYLYPLVKRFPEVIFRERSERKYISEKLRPQLEIIEKENKLLLSGKNGVFEVMADKRGKWIPKTWKEKIKPVDGSDLRLKETIQELQQQKDKK